MLNEVTTDYKEYKIITGQYLHHNAYYYQIFNPEDKKIVDTLWTDDSIWTSHDDALEKAKWDIDNPEEPASYMKSKPYYFI